MDNKAVLEQFSYCIQKQDEALQNYEEEDIRISYWMACCEIYRFLFTSLKYTESDIYINHLRIILNNPKLKWKDIAYYKQNYIIQLNGKLIVDSWSNFELLVTLCSDKLLSEEQQQIYTKSKYNKAINILAEDCRTEDVEKKYEFLKEKYFTRVSVNDKYNSLFEINNDRYKALRDIKKDRRFLEICAKIRNGIHNNYIYFGTDDSYTFQDETITFENYKPITFDSDSDDTILNITIELNKIAEALIKSINHPELIYDPSHDLIIEN